MHKKCILLFLMLFFTCLGVQSSRHDPENYELKFSLGPIFKINKMGTGYLNSLGGRFNMAFGYLVVGVGGYGAVAQNDIKINGLSEKIAYSYGALAVGLRLFPDSLIHLTSYNTFGVGRLDLKNSSQGGLAYSIEPELNLELDLFSLLRLGTGVAYRFLFSRHVINSSSLFGVGGHVYVEVGRL
jgi:hypothetical protein